MCCNGTSGVKALAALGLIASVVGVVDFGGEVVSRIKDTCKNLQDLPNAFRELKLLCHYPSMHLARSNHKSSPESLTVNRARR